MSNTSDITQVSVTVNSLANWSAEFLSLSTIASDQHETVSNQKKALQDNTMVAAQELSDKLTVMEDDLTRLEETLFYFGGELAVIKTDIIAAESNLCQTVGMAFSYRESVSNIYAYNPLSLLNLTPAETAGLLSAGFVGLSTVALLPITSAGISAYLFDQTSTAGGGGYYSSYSLNANGEEQMSSSSGFYKTTVTVDQINSVEVSVSSDDVISYDFDVAIGSRFTLEQSLWSYESSISSLAGCHTQEINMDFLTVSSTVGSTSTVSNFSLASTSASMAAQALGITAGCGLEGSVGNLTAKIGLSGAAIEAHLIEAGGFVEGGLGALSAGLEGAISLVNGEAATGALAGTTGVDTEASLLSLDVGLYEKIGGVKFSESVTLDFIDLGLNPVPLSPFNVSGTFAAELFANSAESITGAEIDEIIRDISETYLNK